MNIYMYMYIRKDTLHFRKERTMDFTTFSGCFRQQSLFQRFGRSQIQEKKKKKEKMQRIESNLHLWANQGKFLKMILEVILGTSACSNSGKDEAVNPQ